MIVPCFRCKEKVDKNETIPIKLINKEQRYECFKCYNRNKTSDWGLGDEIQIKRNFVCQRCRYKFSAKSITCPYCDKSDLVVEDNITVRDLI